MSVNRIIQALKYCAMVTIKCLPHSPSAAIKDILTRSSFKGSKDILVGLTGPYLSLLRKYSLIFLFILLGTEKEGLQKGKLNLVLGFVCIPMTALKKINMQT